MSENRQRMEKASALAARVAGDINIALATGRMSGGTRLSCVAALAEAQQLLKEMEPKRA